MGYTFKEQDAYELATVLSAKTKEKGDEMFFEYCPYCYGGGGKDRETFSINLKSGAFKCFRSSCDKHGHFAEMARDFHFKLESDIDIGSKKYRTIPQKEVISTDKAIEFMASRGIGEDVCKQYRITTQTKHDNILVFPFYDENNILVCAKYRKTDFDKKRDKNKEWFERDTKPILFGMAQCKDFGTLVITEGQIDSLSLAECGIANAVSVPTGANGFTWLTHCWEWITKFENVIVFGDCEKGKITLLETLQQRLPQKILAIPMEYYLGEKDANDILRKYGKGAILEAIKNAEIPKLKNVKELAEVESVDINSLPKIKTGIKELDRIVGGFYYGQVILLSGKRGEGKSTLSSQFVAEALDQGESVFVYSGELADYHFKRWLDFQLAGDGNITTATNEYGDEIYNIEADTINQINNWYRGRAYIYDNNYIPDDTNELESLTVTIENAIKQYGCRLICVDNLMTAMDTVTDQRNLFLAQSNFVGALKKIAVRYDVVIILIAHPRKSKEAFTSDDVSGSADITNKVDIVMSYERADERDQCDSHLLVTKNRLTGKLAVGERAIKLFYGEKTRRITSLSSVRNKRYGWDVEKDPLNDLDEIPF